jgi:tetratricopeptide (TPR) repeat protein
MRIPVALLLSILLIPVMLRAQDTDWFQKGIEATDPAEQIRCFTISITTESDPGAAYYCRASVKLRQGDIPGAIDDYTRCIELDSNDAGSYYNRGIAKQHISADYKGAVNDLIRAYEIEPTNASYINMVSEIYVKAEEYVKAISFYLKVLELYPGNPTVYDNLGFCYLATGNSESALRNFNTALALQPLLVDAMLGMALTYYYKKDMVNAKKYIKLAKSSHYLLRHGPEGFEAFKKEGLLYNRKDNEALIHMLKKWE